MAPGSESAERGKGRAEGEKERNPFKLLLDT